MTPSNMSTHPEAASAPHPRREDSRPGVKHDRTTLLRRPRSVEGDEAYHRSVMEQAAIDIAAGW